METEAFDAKNFDFLLGNGLKCILTDYLVAKLIINVLG